MEKLIEVKLKNGKTILALEREIPGLAAAGKLEKEYKQPEETITKDAAADLKPAETKVPPVPVNISSKSIKGGRPKKA